MKESKRNKLIDFIFIIIILLIGLFLYSKYLGVKGLIVKEYRVESSVLTKNFSGVKIIHISDILYGSTVDKKDLNILKNKVNELKPDIIVFTGDLVLKHKKLSDNDIDILKEVLKSMNASIGKYAIKGDNDYNDFYEDIMNDTDFKLLNNSFEEIYYENNDNIYIVGFNSISKDILDIDTAFEFYNEENRKYIIVLVHEGNTISNIITSEYETDLILGGHSLNGSVIIPYYGPLFIPNASLKYYAPEYKKGITNIYISSGIGTEKYHYRFLNKPSVNLYRLKSTK